MIDFLTGVPGKLKTLLDRLTATRAGYLDNLSAGAVAQAATALSTAQWTNARAGYLDLLNFGGVPIVKSIQTGYSTAAPSTGSGEDTRYVDIAITEVAATTKAFLMVLSAGLHRVADLDGGYAAIATAFTYRLTSTNNLRVSRPNINDPNFTFRWYVVEFY